ncbi:MAG: hypothetical protein JXA78_08225 [Anaerolineales bacterium]|nr:hypothetical protein [Anaerolineales bacterium]
MHRLPDLFVTRRAKRWTAPAWRVELLWLLFGALLSGLLGGCAGQVEQITPLPTEFWPTVVAMTLEARGMKPVTPSPTVQFTPSTTPTDTPSATPTYPPTATATQSPTVTPSLTVTPTITLAAVARVITATLDGPSPTPHLVTLPGPPEETPPPEIPEARVQIYQIGELSIVTSPIHVSCRLTPRKGKTLRVELAGEDGRLLAREVRGFQENPWQAARLGIDLEFEISGVSELGRLVISVEDEYGRLVDVNSVNLILISEGVTELRPYSALWQRIIIQEPGPRALILGGVLVVSGRVRPTFDQPLKVMLIAEDGRILGQRLASVSIPIPGDYGTFIAEVPYTVTEMTNALLVVLEDGGQMSEIAHLASQEVILAP